MPVEQLYNIKILERDHINSITFENAKQCTIVLHPCYSIGPS